MKLIMRKCPSEWIRIAATVLVTTCCWDVLSAQAPDLVLHSGNIVTVDDRIGAREGAAPGASEEVTGLHDDCQGGSFAGKKQLFGFGPPWVFTKQFCLSTKQTHLIGFFYLGIQLIS